MSPTRSVAASLPPDIRQDIGIQALARTESVSHIAATHEVSRKFIYQQGNKAQNITCLLVESPCSGVVQTNVQ